MFHCTIVILYARYTLPYHTIRALHYTPSSHSKNRKIIRSTRLYSASLFYAPISTLYVLYLLYFAVVPCYAITHRAVLQHTLLAILYDILYYTIRYYTVLHHTVQSRSPWSQLRLKICTTETHENFKNSTFVGDPPTQARTGNNKPLIGQQ